MTTVLRPPEPNYIVFPDFYLYKSEGGWRWVNSAATRSSPAAFDSPAMCALDAERTLAKGEQPL